MKNIYAIITLFLLAGIASCGGDNPVSTTPVSNNYLQVLTIDSANIRIEMYNENSSILYVGYNEIGFKVFIDNAERTSGVFKYTPVMFHTAGPGHSTPVQSEFLYDASKGMFTGYVCYSMLSDTTSFWYADYNYDNQYSIKKRQFDVVQGTGNQMRIWFDAAANMV